MLRNFLSGQLIEMFRTIVLVTVAICWMFTMSTFLTWVSIAFIPVVLVYSGVFFNLISRRFRTADEAEGALSATVQENFTGVRVVRAFGREAYEVENFDRKNNLFATLWVKLAKLLGPYWGIGDFVTGMQILVVILLGAREAVEGRLTLGQFTVFVSYNAMMAWPIRNLGRILGDMNCCIRRVIITTFIPSSSKRKPGRKQKLNFVLQRRLRMRPPLFAPVKDHLSSV